MLLTEKVFNKNGNNINLGLAPWVSTRILLFYKKKWYNWFCTWLFAPMVSILTSVRVRL